VGTHPKIAVSKQLQTHFKAKGEKRVGTPFPRVPAQLHPKLQPNYFISFLPVSEQVFGSQLFLELTLTSSASGKFLFIYF